MIDVPRDDIVMMLEAGYMYLAMRQFKEAKKVFEGICALVPKHDVPQVALANVYFAQHKFLESVRVLKQTIKERPESAFAHAYLGESQLFYGKKEEAIQSLKLASELDQKGKSGDFARSLLELIQQGYDPVELRKKFKEAEDKNNPKKLAEKKEKIKGK